MSECGPPTGAERPPSTAIVRLAIGWTALCLLAPIGCGGGTTAQSSASPAGRSFGVLAVTEASSDGGADVSLEGIISVDDDCVTLLAQDGSTVLPLWRSHLVEWDGESRAIVFLPNDGSRGVELRDGDAVTLGGTPIDPAEPPVDGPFDGDLSDLLEELQVSWANRPAEACIDRSRSAFGVRSLS